MNAHIRLIPSETVAEDANIHDTHENAEGRDEAPIGLPEEGGSDRNDALGEAPPPLIAEREDRAVGARDANAETKKGVAKLIALAWPSKSKRKRLRRSRARGTRASGRRGRRPALRGLGNLTASRKSPPRGTSILSLTTVRDGTAPRSRPKQSVRS